MPTQKKIQKYIPQTSYPRSNQEWRVLEKEKVTFAYLIDLLKAHHANLRLARGQETFLPYVRYVEKWDSGVLTEANHRDVLDKWRYKNFCNEMFKHTDAYKKINEKFLAEYDSREDLQEIYKDCISHMGWLYDENENCIDIRGEKGTHPFCTRPQNYRMFDYAVSRYGRSTIEIARETPFVEGDLVLLRDTAVGTDADPLRVGHYTLAYSQGQRTPDKSTQRIGTVISVTGEVSRSWRPVKGSKILKVMWLGGDGSIVDVEERRVKWHERPTYKNGMKSR